MFRRGFGGEKVSRRHRWVSGVARLGEGGSGQAEVGGRLPRGRWCAGCGVGQFVRGGRREARTAP